MTDFDSPFPFRDNLGEGPAWDGDTSTLWRVDLHAGLVHALNVVKGEQRTTKVGDDTSFVLPTTTPGEVVVGHGRDIKLIDTDGAISIVGTVDAPPNTRFNDGKTDPLGRAVGGTMLTDIQDNLHWLDEPSRVPRVAGLYAVDGNGVAVPLALDLALGNGLDWDLDRGRFYHVDSLDQRIYVYDFDGDSGAISNRRVFAEIPKVDGLPDGLTVDAEGGLWLALFFTGEIRHFDPDGRVVGRYVTPVSHPTSICFGGDDLKTAFVTSATRLLDDEGRRREPLAGAILTFEPGVAGLPCTKFRL